MFVPVSKLSTINEAVTVVSRVNPSVRERLAQSMVIPSSSLTDDRLLSKVTLASPSENTKNLYYNSAPIHVQYIVFDAVLAID